jgi:hypothetical protein
MSPQEKMKNLDDDGFAYTISYADKNSTVYDVAILNHSKDWFSYKKEDSTVFVRFETVEWFVINEH